MSDQGYLARERERYERAAHRVQCALAFMHGEKRMEPKHLRTGIDMSKADLAGLAGLLIEKGVISMEEYFTALANEAEKEADAYENELSVKHGINLKTF